MTIESHNTLTGREIQLENGVTYEFKNIRIWFPRLQNYLPCNTAMSITADDFEQARSEFWARYRIWSRKRFGYFVRPEIRNTYNITQ